MINVVANWILNAIALFLVSKIISGVHIADFGSALLATLFLSIANLLVKPILILLTLPFTIFTFGLFIFIVNAVVLLLVSGLTPGFKVDGFGTALIASIVLSVISMLLRSLVKNKNLNKN
jgi:putative membrane protein